MTFRLTTSPTRPSRLAGMIACGMACGVAAARAEEPLPARLIGPQVQARSASQAAREELHQARLALLRASVASMRVARAAEVETGKGVGLRDLQREAAQAAGRYNDLRRPILWRLRQDEDYARLSSERESARHEIRRLTDEEKASYRELLPHAKAALEAGRRMTRAQVIALALDPAVEDARLAMVDAYLRLRIARQTARDAAVDHPGVVLAAEDLAAARERIDEANRQLAVALRAEAAAEARR